MELSSSPSASRAPHVVITKFPVHNHLYEVSTEVVDFFADQKNPGPKKRRERRDSGFDADGILPQFAFESNSRLDLGLSIDDVQYLEGDPKDLVAFRVLLFSYFLLD
jgi:hypothetical protein